MEGDGFVDLVNYIYPNMIGQPKIRFTILGEQKKVKTIIKFYDDGTHETEDIQ